MAQYESSVQVGEFSKKSLDQLKKTFAPSLESIFEARKAASDAGAETTKKVSGSTGLLALLIKPFKRLAALLGVAALAVIAFVAALNKNKDKILIFKQKLFYYKFNLFYDRVDWYGTKGCKKKDLISFTWLREIKAKKYPIRPTKPVSHIISNKSK